MCIYMYTFIIIYCIMHCIGTLLLWNAHKFDVFRLDSGMKLVLQAHYTTYTCNHTVYADTVGCFLIVNCEFFAVNRHNRECIQQHITGSTFTFAI